MQHHYLLVVAPGPRRHPLMILRVPWPMPRWRDIMRATTAVMRAHGLRQKDVSSLDGMVPQDPSERGVSDLALVERVEGGYAGTVGHVPRFWLYDWRRGAFKLARAATEVAA